jgi:hypothetical protein
MVMMVLGTSQELPLHSRRGWTRPKLQSTYISETYLLVLLFSFSRHHGHEVVLLRFLGLVFYYDRALLESAGRGA